MCMPLASLLAVSTSAVGLLAHCSAVRSLFVQVGTHHYYSTINITLTLSLSQAEQRSCW